MTIRNLFSAAISVMICCGLFSAELQAQDDLSNILRKFKNYRYGNISLYRLRQAGDIKQLLLKDAAGDGGGSILDEFDAACRSSIENAARRANGSIPTALARVRSEGVCDMSDAAKITAALKEAMAPKSTKSIQDLYIVTERMKRGEQPVIIGLLQAIRPGNIARQLRTVNESEILTIDALKTFAMPDDGSFSAKTMYDYLVNAIIQGRVENLTPDAQGIGSTLFAPTQFGIVEPVALNEADISPEDIQAYLRISEGQPQIYTKPHEVIVGPDILSYRQYREVPIDPNVDPNDPEYLPPVLNYDLPKFGFEMRYGIEDMNYPSLWSERLSLNAILNNVKLGVILPTAGWATLSEQFGADRTMTNGGFGVNAAFDFPVKIIPSSGVFRLSGSYVFDDASQSSYRDHDNDEDVTFTRGVGAYGDINDYLMRFNAALYYSFAVNIDQDHAFRIKFGGAVYTMETWANQLVEDSLRNQEVTFSKREEETVGGVSGRIEYMSYGSYPYGGSVQYLDEAISGNIWFQIPFSDDFFARAEANYFVSAFRDERAWENSSVFIPSLRLIYNF